MSSRQKNLNRAITRDRRNTPRLRQQITLLANEFIVREYPIGFLGGAPLHLRVQTKELWVVPILLTSPGYGSVGPAGLVAIDAAAQEVVASTPRPEVVAAGRRLRESKRDELEAAFHRARAV